MAASNFFQAQRALFVSLTFFLLLLTRVSLAEKETVSFSFPRFMPDHNQILTLQADAVTQTGHLRLNKVEGGQPVNERRGRALYSAPIHIWDNRSGHVASFATSFSFIITARRPAGPNRTAECADGIAFFLAPVDTQPKADGGFLGLFKDDKYNKSNKIVAVEFDTFPNHENWDPRFRHIGIDVNSIKSTKTTQWDFRDRKVADVYISYKASSKILMATLYYPEKSFTVTDVVDLKDILPEWVRIGFSASTGAEAAIHDIISWSFHSELPISSGTEAFMKKKAHLSSFVQRV